MARNASNDKAGSPNVNLLPPLLLLLLWAP